MKVHYSDKEILDGLLLGQATEDVVLKYIYQKNRDRLLAYVKKNNGSEAEAKDVFQESIIAFFENVKAGKFKGESSISSYLYSIVKFNWLNRLKRKKIEQRVVSTQISEEKTESQLDVILAKEKEQNLMQIFNLLGERCKELLILSIYYNYSMKEILEKTTISSAQLVRNKKYLCLKKLKEIAKNKPSIFKF